MPTNNLPCEIPSSGSGIVDARFRLTKDKIQKFDTIRAVFYMYDYDGYSIGISSANHYRSGELEDTEDMYTFYINTENQRSHHFLIS